MATFPNLAIRIAKIVGHKEFRGGPMASSRLPYYLQVQVFPAVIPRNLADRTKEALKIASLCYTIDQSIQISQIKNPDLKSIAATQMNFTNVGHTSPVPKEAERKSVFQSLSLSSDYAKIAEVLETYRELIDPSFVIPSRQDFIVDVVG